MIAGYLVWVAGTKGPEPQRVLEVPRALGSGYWAQAGRIVGKPVPLDEVEYRLTLDALATKYPVEPAKV